MKVKVAQSCPSLCNSMDYHGVLQARILEWVAFPLLQQIFPTRESNQGLLHCRQTLYQLNYQGSPVSSVQLSCSVMSNSLGPHELQYTRPPCPSPTSRVCSNSRPLSRWCHPTISSSVVPFSSCPQSFPASGFFPMSQLFT